MTSEITIRRYSVLPLAAALISIGVGCLVVIGWVLDIGMLKSIVPSSVPMKFNTAIGFVLAGATLMLVGEHKENPWRQRAGLVVSGAVLLLGLLTFSQHLLGWDLGIDQMLFEEKTPVGSSPLGRMAPATAIEFIIIGAALVLIDQRSGRQQLAQLFATLAGLIGSLGILGYLYEVESFYRFNTTTSMAANTAFLFFILSVGILFARPETGIIKCLIKNRMGGLVARRMLPFLLLLPVAMGYLVLRGNQAGLYDAAFGISFLVITMILALTAIVLWNARSLNAADQELRRRVTTEQELMHAAMIRERDLSNSLVYNLPGIFYMIDENGKFLRWNTRFEEVTGYSPSEVGMMDPLDFFEGREKKYIGSQLRRAFKTGKADAEAHLVTKNGKRVPYHFAGAKITLDNQPAFIGMGIDITERKRAESTLAKQQHMLRTLINNIPDRIYVKDTDCRFLLNNIAHMKALGAKTLGEIVGKTDFDYRPQEIAERSNIDDQNVIRSGEPLINREETTVFPNGEKGWVLSTKVPLRDNEGSVIGLVGISHDITERKHAEEALQLSEEKFRSLFENVREGVYQSTPAGRLMTVNPAFVKMFGYDSEDEILTIDIDHGLYADSSDRQRLADALIEHGEVVGLEARLLKKNGEEVIVLENARAVRNEGGDLLYYEGTLTDITERKRREEEIRKLSLAVEQSPVSIIITNVMGIIEYVNPRFTQVTGYTSEEVVGKNPRMLKSGNTPMEVYRCLWDTITSGRQWSGEIHNKKKNGELFWERASISPITDSHGKITHYLGVKEDITEKRKSENRLRLLAHAVTSAKDCVCIADLEDNLIFVNEAFCEVYGYTREEILGKKASVLRAASVTPEEGNKIYEATLAGSWYGEVMNRRKDGTIFPIELWTSAVNDESARAIATVGISRDITARKRGEETLHRQAVALEQANTRLLASKSTAEEQAELLRVQAQELIAAREAALEASRLKSEFVANMSHEIRTPMNGIIGMTSLLLDTELSSEQREFAEIVRKSGDGLLTVINDILDFSKIEAGKMSIENIDFDLISVVEGVVELLTPRAQEKGLELGCLMDREVLRSVHGDPGRVRQILTNLIGNAIKFTDKGEVTVAAMIEEETDRHITVRFTVADTGIGISDEAKTRVFQSFSQADGSTTRKYGGTGLGLAISKQLVELMGGTIGVDSELGKGSCFWWTLPFERTGSPARIRRTGLTGLRCLIVDDSKVNRTIVHHYITSWGMGNGSAQDAPRALELLRRAARAGQPYDLAILDMQMPGMDGVQLARLIKADDDLSPTRLILLTSMGNQNNTLLSKVGFSASLAKPIRQSQLFDCIANVMGNTLLVSERGIEKAKGRFDDNSKECDRTRIGTDPRKGLRILIAEDNPVNQKVAVRMLEKLGYAPDVAGNGSEALLAVSNVQYDIVFMDCQMPEVDGLEATGQIRAMEGTTRHTTIIAMTAHALQGDREKCIAAGMDDYIAKPLRQDDLASAIDRWSLAKEAANNHTDTHFEPDPLLDESILASVSALAGDDDPRLAEHLLSMFIAETPCRIEHIREATRLGNPHDVCTLAHIIKGTCAQLGLIAMVSICAQLEEQPESRASGDCASLVDKLEDTYRATKQLLDSRFTTREV